MVLQMYTTGKQARGIDEETRKVKHAIVIGTNWQAEGGGGVIKEHQYKILVGSTQYYLIITSMTLSRIENLILVSQRHMK